jgi:hypothetical protein
MHRQIRQTVAPDEHRLAPFARFSKFDLHNSTDEVALNL